MNPQRQKREARKRKEQQRFVEPMTQKRAGKTARAETNNAYNPVLRQNQAMIKASRERQGQLNDWYQNFANDVATSRQMVDAAYAQANQTNTANIQGVAGADQARQAEVTQAANQFGQMTGGPGVTPQEAQTNAAAGQQRQLYGSILAAPVAAQGANAFAYLTNQQTAVKGEGLRQKQAEQKRRLGFQGDKSALLKEKGNYLNTKMDELRKAERDYRIQLRAFPEAEKDRQLSREEAEKDRNIDWYNAKTGRKNAETGEGGEGGDNRTQAQIRADRREFKNGMTAVPALAKELRSYDLFSWDALVSILVKRAKIDYVVAQNVVNRYRKQQKTQRQGGSHDNGSGRSPGLNAG